MPPFDSPLIQWTFNILAILIAIYCVLWIVLKTIEFSSHRKSKKHAEEIHARCDALEEDANRIESEIRESMKTLVDLPTVERVSIETKFSEALDKISSTRKTIHSLRKRYPIKVTQ